MLLVCVYITIYFMYVQRSINMVPCQSITAIWSLGVCARPSITVYCCYCRSRWVLPCSCGPSTGPRCWRRHAAEASSRWCGPDLWPPQNCWSCAAGRSLGWLQRHTDTHPHKETWQTHSCRLTAEVTGCNIESKTSNAWMLSPFLLPLFGWLTVWINMVILYIRFTSTGLVANVSLCLTAVWTSQVEPDHGSRSVIWNTW